MDNAFDDFCKINKIENYEATHDINELYPTLEIGDLIYSLPILENSHKETVIELEERYKLIIEELNNEIALKNSSIDKK